MRGRERDSEARGAPRYARITNRRNEKPFFLQGVGEVHRIVFLADDEWKDRALGFAIRFAGKQLMKQFDIFPKRAPALLARWSLQEFDRCNCRRSDRGWGRR